MLTYVLSWLVAVVAEVVVQSIIILYCCHHFLIKIFISCCYCYHCVILLPIRSILLYCCSYYCCHSFSQRKHACYKVERHRQTETCCVFNKVLPNRTRYNYNDNNNNDNNHNNNKNENQQERIHISPPLTANHCHPLLRTKHTQSTHKALTKHSQSTHKALAKHSQSTHKAPKKHTQNAHNTHTQSIKHKAHTQSNPTRTRAHTCAHTILAWLTSVNVTADRPWASWSSAQTRNQTMQPVPTRVVEVQVAVGGRAGMRQEEGRRDHHQRLQRGAGAGPV